MSSMGSDAAEARHDYQEFQKIFGHGERLRISKTPSCQCKWPGWEPGEHDAHSPVQIAIELRIDGFQRPTNVQD